MRYLKYTLLFLAGIVLFASCDKNDPIVFKAGDQSVAFLSSSLQVAEGGNELSIPVSLAGLPGGGAVSIKYDVSIEGISKPAIEGTDFEVISSKTIEFSEGYGEAEIRIRTMNNDIYEGNKMFYLVFTDIANTKPSAENMCMVTVSDDEHPLNIIIGTYDGLGISYFNGETVYTVSTKPDPDDVSKIVFTGFVPGGSNLDIYGVVDLDSKEIKIPVGQDIVKDDTNPAAINGWYGEEGDPAIPADGFITATFDDNGTITIHDWFGSKITEGVNDGLWFNIMQAGSVLTKAAAGEANINTTSEEFTIGEYKK
ncbi:hypothetical protein KDU71_16655 [Carboxylicivirga sediminis]|uniref:Calx-beta domain-containing protein n=1 Tax=Carboxylicivirga sediminis TaxID=2006564 RepID=A0A941F7F8_9BACT|nr:Calx-beta domain-containing protein [Carboxylicivirga sediminis]MBR8537203.1 hypothetical protein [Carboxylicivirga sediminis]